ncbi:unnamed protein product [Paramecium sonneborni]|uniref:Uncharacterized protein n=1 Tax=Paramecium sonneborni TaxID=65129 RepID=A0A8S1RS63_9CILI|nr:unnamed protein product [Paramecium sonneborni]
MILSALVVQYFAQHEQIKYMIGDNQGITFKIIIMFIDVSGLEILQRVFQNQKMKDLNQQPFDDDRLKFSGDAIMVVLPPFYKQDIKQLHYDLSLTWRIALQNLLDIQNKLNDSFNLSNLKLSVKIDFEQEILILYIQVKFIIDQNIYLQENHYNKYFKVNIVLLKDMNQQTIIFNLKQLIMIINNLISQIKLKSTLIIYNMDNDNVFEMIIKLPYFKEYMYVNELNTNNN